MAAVKPPKDLESSIQQSPKRTSNGEPRIGVNAVTWPTYVVFGLALAYPIINARCVRENESAKSHSQNRIEFINFTGVSDARQSHMSIFHAWDFFLILMTDRDWRSLSRDTSPKEAMGNGENDNNNNRLWMVELIS